jgi:hypothetical protein
MLSGPLALCELMLSSSFRMPGVVMVSGGISGCGLTPLLGMLSIDSVVNTDLNCSFKMFAFCLVSATSLMKKDKKYKEKYKQLKHQVQKEQSVLK